MRHPAFTTCTKAGAISLLLFLSACVSGYSQFYTPAPGATPERIAALRAAPSPREPVVERAVPPAEWRPVLDSYAKRGYALIGSSSFNSGNQESDNAAVEQGRSVGADLVLILSPRYAGSVTSVVPITTPTTTTSYSTSNATAYGSLGAVNAFGTTTTTSYGSQTNYVPITINRMQYGAAYFVKQRTVLGINGDNLTDSERQELQSNKGVSIRLVVDNSPAFHADLLAGDIILAFNGEPVLNRESMSGFMKGVGPGSTIVLSIYRKGQRMEKSVVIK